MTERVRILVWRELRSTLGDWRLLIPALGLSLIVPTAVVLLIVSLASWLQQFAPQGVRFLELALPFAGLMMGFIPTTFSLVIALESFVGERERKSLEALLATPIDDRELYAGKFLASALFPLLTSHLGLLLYGVGLGRLWPGGVEPVLFGLLSLTLTLVALALVAAAVLLSTLVDNLRTANLLAGFFILPAGAFVQVQGTLLLRRRLAGVLWLDAFLFVLTLILVRMGMNLFQRERLLTGSQLSFHPRRLWTLWRRFLRRPVESQAPPLVDHPPLPWPQRLRRDLPPLLRRLRRSWGIVLLWTFGAFVAGYLLGRRLDLPVPQPGEALPTPPAGMGLSLWIFAFNLRTLLVGLLLTPFTLGGILLLQLGLSLGAAGLLAGAAARAGLSPWAFALAFYLPHGPVEILAVSLLAAAALELGASLMRPPPGFSLEETFLLRLSELVRILILILPLLLLAALLEGLVTPRWAAWVWGP